MLTRAVVLSLALLAMPAWAQQPQSDPVEQAVVAQFQAMATQMGNVSEAVQKLVDSRRKLKEELDALKQPKVSEVPPPK